MNCWREIDINSSSNFSISSFRAEDKNMSWAVSRSLWKFLSDDRAKGQIWAHFEALFHIPQLMLRCARHSKTFCTLWCVWCVCRLSTIQSLVLSCGKWSVSRNFRGWKLITCWAVRKNNNRPQVLALQNFKSLIFSLSLLWKKMKKARNSCRLKKEPFHHVVVMAVD